ncbi:acyl-CoA dehydrogenase family protein [Streptomyces sp. NPDC046805]|uniref:acyl-CoA dehydrogenase family protein n=1 Tax=Streptomyces sp. NPDC046805 TaxID=3155134 RepID=UPI0033DD2925
MSDHQPDLAALRDRAAAFFRTHGTPLGAAPSRTREPDAYLTAARAHQQALYDAGLSGITWPEEHHGLGLSAAHETAFEEAAQDYEAYRDVFTIGLGMCGPVLMAKGTDEQRRRHLGPMLRAEHLWCQLFSEPGAGSDLAALSTAAVRDGDTWVVNGQKVWTSFAHHADYGLLLTRTDPDAPKHRGITMFILDMHAPGVTVRPLRQATGDAEFNEVFLDGVRIPAENLVGEVNDGWRAATLMLANERLALRNNPISSGLDLDAVVRLIRGRGLTGDTVLRKRVADAYVAQLGVRLFAERIARAASTGSDPGPLGSVGKVAASRAARGLATLALDAASEEALAWDADDPQGDIWAHGELFAPSLSIAGGTEQIQLTVLGERVLGLPRDPQGDRDTPFRQLRRNP